MFATYLPRDEEAPVEEAIERQIDFELDLIELMGGRL